ncbi:glutamate synthase (NADH) large subunit [Novosphingobium aromaticivorans DSM 12444]|uniref:Glutamate synthase [NADPH] large chain n=1 Tax=Novosphingobium aromaticivorans (strain ATCC 700278 / DSM 12444 / CCUG 56034 / CIP 105152 / NBRC 16084 / F199) TaxID=279238 RepID=Q2G3G2_NOVAD|nr:glutamate synthase large subunit [Novosphingobium aromaticivorans]ABD27611.1 glutamate synthase (NADH) large subunit [Novosphingobium aromaticivorans DSM 12444]SCY32529.1 glutamate synthase (NADH) large subunit [Novosphingobium aromaticivorans]
MGFPPVQGLYDPRNEHDACGVGFIAHIKGQKSHAIVDQALEILRNLDHRGAVGADPLLGDGAGILIQIPDQLFRRWAASEGKELPQPGDYAVAMCFLPQDEASRLFVTEFFEKFIAKEGQELIGWRDVPTTLDGLGKTVIEQMPVIRQCFIKRGPGTPDQDAFERKLLAIRKQTQNPLAAMAEKHGLPGVTQLYMPSFSTRTIVYKGLLLANQVGSFYDDLRDPDCVSALGLVHQRFSTNTFPSWKLAHPFRFIAHNGEINTVRGNVNWMNARRRTMESELLGPDLDKMWPLIPHGQSDTASLDNALELLLAGGYSLAHAVMMLVPEAWAGNPLMDSRRRAFYEYHAALMEPWDGPAAVAFTDGRQIGATLDRNGLRPARFSITRDDLICMASESGVLPFREEDIVRKWRLQPGKMLLIDMDQGKIIEDEEIKAELAGAEPYEEWLDQAQYKLKELDVIEPELAALPVETTSLLDRQQAFGYTQEDVTKFLEPMAVAGDDPIGSMGTDTPIAVLSKRSRLLYDYFKQNFAQVTNPPIDPIREELVMSLVSMIGPRPNLLGHDAGSHKRLEVDQPILTNDEIAKIRSVEAALDGAFRTATIDTTWDANAGADGLEMAIKEMCWAATEAVLADKNILILSDRAQNENRIPMPALLATAAVHHHLVRQGLRMQTGLVVETGEAREVHHFCVLAGYGAEAINPYLAFETLEAIRVDKELPLTTKEVQKNYIKAIGKGILKVMSKMGISTYQSYCGAQIFDAVGLSTDFVNAYFTGTATTIEGVGLKEIAEETVRRHATAYGDNPIYKKMLDVGGMYQLRLRGEEHAWTASNIANLQHAVRGNMPEKYKEFAQSINDQSERMLTIRGLMDLKKADQPISIDEVEPASEIVKRFATGAMSYGSISWEAHTTLALAMNRIGGKSNTGEGGEDPARFKPLPNGDSMRSAIKQVASGRFGVTAEYLVNADDVQIKMAQGAKPGEGGQLPGDKVDKTIGKTRHSTPGVGLISPPPHHDIYSIEDLAQLIHDLKNVNTGARISVKLVSEVGVGTVAAGVSKARADHVTISGYEGGTGASPLTSLTHAGSPWEIGLAETQQTLLLNNLRSRICVQADGGLRTGRDVAIAALLGADEFGFATAPLIAAGCIMMRKCHLNTCPVGVATQDPVLRARFTGQPEHVINYFFFVAEELRAIMAEMGFRTIAEMVGRVDRLDTKKAISHWKAQGVDLSKLLHKVDPVPGTTLNWSETQDHGLEAALDNDLIAASAPALEKGEPVRLERNVINVNRTVGAMLSGEVARKYGHKGLPDNTIHVAFKGVAGQSFGAFLAHGVTLDLVGDANDYVGKGLSGGRVIVRQPGHVDRDPTENIIVGNTVLYGAIAGEAYFNGVGGERFAVRNSGALAVVEGTGDHGCEYMTGGVVVVLGRTGRNFAAGMSGGVAYVYDVDGNFASLVNGAMVDVLPVSAERDEEDGAGRPQQRGTDVYDQGMGDMLRHDAERLRVLVERHHLYTGSARAREILDNWVEALPRFVKVMPRDYARALRQMEAERLEAASVAAE